MQKINKLRLVHTLEQILDYEYMKKLYFIQSKLYYLKYDNNSILDLKFFSRKRSIKNSFNTSHLSSVNNDYDKLCKEFIKLDNKLQNYFNNRVKQIYYIIRLPIQVSDILKLINVSKIMYKNSCRVNTVGSYSLLQRLHNLYNKYKNDNLLFNLECAHYNIEQYEIKDKHQVFNEYDRLTELLSSDVRNLYYHEQDDFFPAHNRYNRYNNELSASKDDIQIWQLDYFKNGFDDEKVAVSSVKYRLNLR